MKVSVSHLMRVNSIKQRKVQEEKQTCRSLKSSKSINFSSEVMKHSFFLFEGDENVLLF